MKEEKIRHIEMIQQVILRMNSNSFQIKGLTISVAIILLMFDVQFKNIQSIWIFSILLILFWLIGSYNLLQARKFRSLCKDAVIRKVELFSMQSDDYQNFRKSIIATFFSFTIFLFIYH